MRSARRAAPLLLAALLAIPCAAQQFDVNGYVSLRAVHATGPESWLAGDFGRLEAGGDRVDFFASAFAGIDWTPSRYFNTHVSATARRDPGDFAGDKRGIIEAYADLRLPRGLNELRLRAGQFFLPTSRENIDPIWASPFTINFSTLNTWIGQEVRPIGADLEYRHVLSNGLVLTGAGTLFQGNDSMGTMLAWRGWTLGDRMTTYGEVLPLPPIGSLNTWFALQRDDGSKPFGPDLDGRTGWAGRFRAALPPTVSVQYSYLDNRGDYRLYRGEWAWETKFHQVGVSVGDPDRLSMAAEYLNGVTEAVPRAVFVESGFYSGYLLVSAKSGRQRYSARYEMFGATELDETEAERNDETGRAWTLTWMLDVTPSLRGALEYSQITGDRPAAQQYGFDPNTNGRSVTAELRYRF